MLTTHRAPTFVGVFPPDDGAGLAPEAADRIWPDLPGTWRVGGWHPDECRVVRHGDAGLVVIGHCLAGDDRLRTLLERLAATGRPEVPPSLPGSCLAVLVQPDSVTATVDLAGQFPLYYHETNGRVVLGTQARATAVTAGLPLRPDLTTLAAQIFCPDVPALAAGNSVLEGVRRLGGGQTLRVDRRGRLRVWAEPLIPERSVTAGEAEDGLRAALEAAVAARLGACAMSADLSGGLDSTSLAFLAARRTVRPLPVFTYHHPDAPAGDVAHARRFWELAPNFRPELILGTRDTLAFADVRPGAGTDVPDPGATARARTHLRLSRIAATGGGIHLGGEGADALLTPSPGYLADLGRFGSKRELARHAHGWGRARRLSPAAIFTRAVRMSSTSMAVALRRLAAVLETPDRRATGWADAIGWWSVPGREADWLTRPMRHRLAEECRAGAETSPPGAPGIADVGALHSVRAAATVQRQLVETARPYGIRPHAPFLDDEVVRAGSRLPAYRRGDPHTSKALLRKALAGLVPEPVLSRPGKGNYLAEDFAGLRAGSAALVELFTDSRLAAWGMIEPAEVIGAVRATACGQPAALPALNRLISAEIWLRGL